MKLSEFINQIKDDIQYEVERYYDFVGEEIAKQNMEIRVIETLIKDDKVLNQTAKFPSGRFELISINENLKALNNSIILKILKHLSNQKFEEKYKEAMKAAKVAALEKAKEVEENIEPQDAKMSFKELKQFLVTSLESVLENMGRSETNSFIEQLIEYTLKELNIDSSKELSEQEIQQILLVCVSKMQGLSDKIKREKANDNDSENGL